MLNIKYYKSFKKDYKAAIKRGCKAEEIVEVITLLSNQTPLPLKYRDHALNNTKQYKNVRECHIGSDWLLIYKIKQNELILELIRTGSHSDLF